MSPFGAYTGSKSPKILFVGEAWGENEENRSRPFCGHAGREFTKLCARTFEGGAACLSLMEHYDDAWLYARDNWFKNMALACTNVFNLRPKNNKLINICYEDRKDRPKGYSLPPLSTIPGRGQIFLKEEYFGEIERLWHEIELTDPNLIVALGNTACWALLGRRDITQIRGTTTLTKPNIAMECLAKPTSATMARRWKVLPTLHPSTILQGMHKWRPIIQADFIKVKRESETRELSRPERRIIVNPSLEDIKSYVAQICSDPEMACDTETARGQITRVSFATSPNFALVIPFRDKECKSNYWPDLETELKAWKWVKYLLGLPCAKIFQNGLYDLQFFAKMGIRVKNCVDDTLIMHHALFLEMQKSLGFLGSIYTDEPAWKLMRLRRKERGEKEDE